DKEITPNNEVLIKDKRKRKSVNI
ncbi:MAG: hypothetical protein RLZZ243_864, partial [Bacteroidota bacterium]